MSNINELNSIDIISAGDSFAIYDLSSVITRKVPYSTLQAQLQSDIITYVSANPSVFGANIVNLEYNAVEAFGFVGDGVTDNTSAWAKMILAVGLYPAPSGNALDFVANFKPIVNFPEGNYRFASDIEFQYSGVTIKGQGFASTKFTMVNCNLTVGRSTSAGSTRKNVTATEMYGIQVLGTVVGKPVVNFDLTTKCFFDLYVRWGGVASVDSVGVRLNNPQSNRFKLFVSGFGRACVVIDSDTNNVAGTAPENWGGLGSFDNCEFVLGLPMDDGTTPCAPMILESKNVINSTNYHGIATFNHSTFQMYPPPGDASYPATAGPTYSVYIDSSCNQTGGDIRLIFNDCFFEHPKENCFYAYDVEGVYTFNDCKFNGNGHTDYTYGDTNSKGKYSFRSCQYNGFTSIFEGALIGSFDGIHTASSITDVSKVYPTGTGSCTSNGRTYVNGNFKDTQIVLSATPTNSATTHVFSSLTLAKTPIHIDVRTSWDTTAYITAFSATSITVTFGTAVPTANETVSIRATIVRN